MAAASVYLKRLTCERYQRVWTPLTERRLIVEDHEGNSHPVEALSRGAREQLYLAVRLAVIDRLAATGVELPLLLDDVFVNFDQPRTEAAIDLLLEFASRGRQLVFVTCHQHLVQMFRERGVEPTWLPGLAGDSRPDRLAG
ncbi:MAG: hypothetical protein NT069_31955 [Planctomycetota bacterium]|nr:hypothetical protein [Planctomycetota bacterium]